MNIQAKISLLANSTNNVKAMASITFDNVFVVTGIRVLQGQNGMFAAMPSRKTASGEYKDVCFPLNGDFRKEINDKVIEAYNKEVEQSQNNVPEPQQMYSNYEFGNPDDLPF